jgi:hypothetical protein
VLQGCAIGEVGEVLDMPQFLVLGLRGEVVINSDIVALKDAWQRPLRW